GRVVGDGQVRAEDALTDVADEEGRAVLERRAGQGDHVEPFEHFANCGRLEDDVVRAGCDCRVRSNAESGFFDGFIAEGDDVEAVAGDAGGVAGGAAADGDDRRAGGG